MFDSPEYASYIELMRALRLERKAQPGDVALLWHDVRAGPYVFLGPNSGWRHPRGWFRAGLDFEAKDIWLPRLDQWLAMLVEAGLSAVALRYNGEWWVAQDFVSPRPAPCGKAPSPEEAAARLWKAVVDEIAQREGVTSY